ncbi:TetR/AcrR family transcriptional regulator [Streptomyces sp. NPDC001691]|uniref:TetR/AcrR family transcriptional regulator n=1 Tax=unclassified Streptomyces TaxID=2593676 RepID=UPI000DEA7949|nr:TetR/AcrR family transcriptional regulator [Streptomyces sp. SDr-06]RCH66536.1 TetR/AcrR family transcriptional regulator [Streptomyces sp. SDr-06]
MAAADRAKDAARTSVWLGSKAQNRVRRSEAPEGGPVLDRDRITAEAVRLLDAEGSAKFSMRRLAAELGVTAMSLYWYVDTKDDLLELALDSVFAEIELPDMADESADWRDQLRDIARGYRAVFVRHAWASALIGRYLNIGPHAMAFASAAQRLLARTGLPPHGQMGGMAAVFQFVYGFGTIEGTFVRRCADAGLTQDEYFAQAMGALNERPAYRVQFEDAAELMAARGGDTVQDMRQRDFDFALSLLVAGIEALSTQNPG